MREILPTILVVLAAVVYASEKKVAVSEADSSVIPVVQNQTLQGNIQISDKRSSSDWISKTKVVVDGGRYIGFVNSHGEFAIHNVPPGSYVVEVVSPNYGFDPVRVDISSKSGKIRARKVNLLKTTSVSQLPYPLRFTTSKRAEFFEKKESWSILSALKNPMVLLLVAPVLLMMLLPRLMKSLDPESQKEMQESMSAMQQGTGMPSLEEMFTNMFGGGSGGQTNKQSTSKKTKTSNLPKRSKR